MHSKELLNLSTKMISYHEGFIPLEYYCTKGVRTIGYGFNISTLTEKELELFDMENEFLCISEYNAKLILKERLEDIIIRMPKNIKYFNDLSITRQAVLIDLCYNLGMNGLLKFKNFLKYLEDKDYINAGDELLRGSGKDGKSLYYIDVGIRAERLSNMIKYNDNSFFIKDIEKLK